MSIYWEEDEEKEPYKVPENIIDITYQLKGKTLPVDHAYELSQAIRRVLPWMETEEGAGVHQIYVAASSNGWERPDDSESGQLHLSRRTKMTLRVPSARLSEAEQLTGMSFDIAGNIIELGKTSVKKLSTLTTIFSRYVSSGDQLLEEPEFLEYLVSELGSLGIRPKKILCGKESRLQTPDGPVYARSVMISDLEPEQSVRIQEKGLGAHRLMGCGLFLPHKGIKPVGDMSEKQHFAG
jgi:CRISPR-associated protein Cas6